MTDPRDQLIESMAEKIWLMSTHLTTIAERKLTNPPPMEATMDDIMKWAYLRAFESQKGDSAYIAAVLEVDVSTLFRWCDKWGLQRPIRFDDKEKKDGTSRKSKGRKGTEDRYDKPLSFFQSVKD